MNNIDHIFYINLDKRTDRLDQILTEFDKMELPTYKNTPERFPALYTPDFGILGCTKSHCEVMKIALERQYENILIFEDDFTFLVNKEVFEKEIQQIFENNVNFDVVMFSYNIKKSQEDPQYPFLKKIINASTASCYLVNGKYLPKLINLYEEAIPLLEQTKMHWEFANDVVWCKLMEVDNWYATNTRVGIQRPSYSDNSKEFMDHGC
jgi:GR25 family glycosyltransferase involved in LPS biosynthesis